MKADVWRLGGLSPTSFLKQVWSSAWDDSILSQAGQLAFFLMLAFFPLLLLISVILANFASEGSELRSMLLGYAAHVLPGSASGVIKNAIAEINKHQHGHLLSISLGVALWSASQGMLSVINILNQTYEVNETRPWWKQRLVALALTLLLIAFLLLALVAVLLGGWAADYLARSVGSSAWLTVWYALRWPLVMLLVFVGFGWVYLLAPNFQEHKWYWVAPGALGGVAIWIASSLLFKLYLQHFNSYAATYGSFGAIIVVMLWFYVTSIALMLGGEVNSIIENAADSKGNPDAQRRKRLREAKANGSDEEKGRG